MVTPRSQDTHSRFRFFLQALAWVLCWGAQHTYAVEAPLRCSIAHAGAGSTRQARASMSVEIAALEQIQKDLAGNRPLLAVVRSSKRDPKLESALIHIVQSLPREIGDSFASQTGFGIEQGRLVLRQEVKAVPKEWGAGFVREALKSLEPLTEARRPTQSQPKLRSYKLTAKDTAEFIETLYNHIILHHLLRDKETARLSILFMKQFRERLKNELLPTREALLYFFMIGEHVALDTKTSIIYQVTGDATPEAVAEIYNGLHPDSPMTIADVGEAMLRFPEMLKAVEREIFLNLSRKSQTENQIAREQNSEVKSSSLKELIQDLDAPSAEVVSANLITLIQSVDSSDAQVKKVTEALQDSRPQLRLLELAYVLKQYQELSQKEIQAAVFEALDEVTKPRMPEEISAPVMTESVDTTAPTTGPQGGRDSKSRIAKMKLDLQSPNSDFRLLIHNEKEFFDLLKPGTGRFEAVEKDIEVLRQKFTRVFSYFNGTRRILPGDGHFSPSNRRIFDLKYGQYRLLMTRASGTANLVVLIMFHKSDADDQNKENRFYKLADRRLNFSGY